MMRRRLREVPRDDEVSLSIGGDIAWCKYAMGLVASAIGNRCLAEIVGTLAQSHHGVPVRSRKRGRSRILGAVSPFRLWRNYEERTCYRIALLAFAVSRRRSGGVQDEQRRGTDQETRARLGTGGRKGR